MKKLSLLFLLPILFFSCSSDDNDNEPKQDYTSFVFEQAVDIDLPNCVVGYLDIDKNYIKVAELGNLEVGESSKEIRVDNDNVIELHFFTDYLNTIRVDTKFILEKQKKNVFKLVKGPIGIPVTDKEDSKQYPQ